uniref:Uncharacterized protein n=1 Tax=Coccidioides posadasii RMSCC 3488 TaxID=454284 RepID=A0A0J6FAD0_COCPO|nr:hypothetical protein CPAG_02255 [Coccidioides posadasii RMSCC 3488]
MGETVDARPLLQRHASAPLIHCHAVDAGATDDPAERLTVIECLEELHYNEVAVLKTELGGRINKLSSLRLKLEEERMCVQHLIYQFDDMHCKKEQIANQASSLARINTALSKKNVAIRKETEGFKQEMNVIHKRVLDAIVHEREKAGIAKI